MNYKAFRLVGKGRFYLLERLKNEKLLSILLLSAFCTLATGCGVKDPIFPEKEQPQNTQNTIKLTALKGFVMDFSNIKRATLC